MAVSIDRETMYRLVYSRGLMRRYTQDSPVLADVWAAFAEAPDDPVDLLLTPYQSGATGVRPAALMKALRDRLLDDKRLDDIEGTTGKTRWPRTRAACNRTTLVATLTLPELVRGVLPLSPTGGRVWAEDAARVRELFKERGVLLDALNRELEEGAVERRRDLPRRSAAAHQDRREKPKRPEPPAVPPYLLWAIRVIGSLAHVYRREDEPFVEQLKVLYAPDVGLDLVRELGTGVHEKMVEAFTRIVYDLRPPPQREPLLHTVTLNRRAGPTVMLSRRCVKADAAEMLFAISCKDLTWAVIDSGIDAEHPAFRLRDPKGCLFDDPYKKDKNGRLVNQTRVTATFDFRVIRQLLSIDPDDQNALPADLKKTEGFDELGQLVRERLNQGQEIDWQILRPFLEVPIHAPNARREPNSPHGTHVAGILAGDWRVSDKPSPGENNLVGLCRDLKLMDFRVFDADGEGDEFTVMSALQFVRWLNAHTDHMVVHGVNLSLSIPHEVRNYACGQTPVCNECERLVGAGLVVVVAAGNKGSRLDEGGRVEGYDSVSITDPGNAEAVITVGSTHRDSPHAYGVSYFSSRGPTGDGRIKPDLVAPGEKITAPLPHEAMGTRDGTSMAAPHVSGAAALLMARHRELVGRPARIKKILCDTATDLGRERYFQGAGLLDVLRAIQSV